MKITLLLTKLALNKEKFIIAETLKKYCSDLKISYLPTIKYLLREEYLVRILRGIFYIKSIEERKLSKININHYEALKKALELKKVKQWYFGLETALKMNNVTHEFFVMDFLITDTIFRPKPITVMGHKIKCIKLHTSLFSFGILKKTIFYSDVEKTLLDIIYLDKYHGLCDELIRTKISELIAYCSKKKIKKYLPHYPRSLKKIVGELL